MNLANLIQWDQHKLIYVQIFLSKKEHPLQLQKIKILKEEESGVV